MQAMRPCKESGAVSQENGTGAQAMSTEDRASKMVHLVVARDGGDWWPIRWYGDYMVAHDRALELTKKNHPTAYYVWSVEEGSYDHD